MAPSYANLHVFIMEKLEWEFLQTQEKYLESGGDIPTTSLPWRRRVQHKLNIMVEEMNSSDEILDISG